MDERREPQRIEPPLAYESVLVSRLPDPDFWTDIYLELDPAACPAGHPPEIVALRACPHCRTSWQHAGRWPSYCQVCHTERMYAARRRMEQEGLICLVCLPMYAEWLGQLRKANEDQRGSKATPANSKGE